MPRLRQFLSRLRNGLLPSRAERELAREIAAHLTLLEDAYRAGGMTPDEARYAARRAIGGVEQTKELHRDARSFRWLEDCRADVRYALRALGRSPTFALVVVSSLALGVGATTVVFSVVRTVLLQPPPFAGADRIVTPVANHRRGGGRPVPNGRRAERASASRASEGGLHAFHSALGPGCGDGPSEPRRLADGNGRHRVRDAHHRRTSLSR